MDSMEYSRGKNLSLKYVERFKGCQPGLARQVNSMLDALLPRVCVCCGLACPPRGVCDSCQHAMPWNLGACERCGLPIEGTSDDVCGSCLLRPMMFDGVFSAFRFNYPVNRLVHRFKFKRDGASGRVLGLMLIDYLGKNAVPMPDLLVPVPMHRLRLLSRGLNPAFELANQLGKALGIPLARHDLRRSRYTRTQTGLDAAARRKNLQGVFEWKGNRFRGEHIALIDDVMTTGSTLTACGSELLKAGAGRVSAWLIARAVLD